MDRGCRLEHQQTNVTDFMNLLYIHILTATVKYTHSLRTEETVSSRCRCAVLPSLLHVASLPFPFRMCSVFVKKKH
jgi:hypothetical protein